MRSEPPPQPPEGHITNVSGTAVHMMVNFPQIASSDERSQPPVPGTSSDCCRAGGAQLLNFMTPPEGEGLH